MHRHQLTQEGYTKMLEEKASLIEKRKGIVAEVTRTRELGDLSENSAYRAAKSALRGIDSRLAFLNKVLLHVSVIEKTISEFIIVGSIIKLQTDEIEQTFQLVDGVEADIMEGKLSVHSPLGRALLGRRAEAIIEYHTPKGKRQATILHIG